MGPKPRTSCGIMVKCLLSVEGSRRCLSRNEEGVERPRCLSTQIAPAALPAKVQA
jgi:hypothetical protein